MKKPDRFMLGIVIAVLVVVVVAFAVARLRPAPTYQSDATAAGTAHNYLFALQQGDDARAYSYLSPTLAGYPASLDAFEASIRKNRWNFNVQDTSLLLDVVGTRTIGDGREIVTVRERRFYQDGLFDSTESENTFEMDLRQEDGRWVIISSVSYWAACWESRDGC